MIKPRLEHTKCQVGKPTQLGLMFEITAPVAPVVEATAQKTKALVFVIDRSGSMAGHRLEMVKATLLDTIPRLNPEDYLSIVTFDDQARVNIPMGKIKDKNPKDLARTVSSIEAGGSTNLELGYRLGLEEAAKTESGIEINLILLSDGQANRGLTSPVELGKLATAATEHLVTTSTIGIGQGYDENILGSLADGGNGNHIAGITQGEATDGLQSEIDGLLQKTMLDVKFRMVLGPDFSGPESKIVAGRRMKKWQSHRGQVDTLLGDLSSGEERNVIFDITLDSHQMATPGVKQGLQIEWSYTDAITGALVSKQEVVEIELVPDADWIEPVRDLDVTAELKLLRAQQLYEKVQRLYWEGRYEEADALLEAAGKELEQFMKDNNLSPRAYDRMNFESTNLLNLSSMADANIKSKMHREMMNRSMRDRRRKEGN